MKIKKLIAVVMTAIMLFTIVSCGLNAYALVMCETQYVYDSANLSWLKDLIVKEDMNSVDGLSQRNTLLPKADYPYGSTAESFKEEVEYYQVIYTLDEEMTDIVYLYLMDIANAFAGSTSSNYSDEFIRSYLESIGIVYPSDAADDNETKIVARALFSIITTDEDFKVKRGTGLYEAFTDYTSVLLGVDIGSVLKFDSDSNLLGLEEYVIAACKYLLYSAGYAVNKDTSNEEVYRLIAIMTIKAQGISIDSGSATFEEIKNKYLCAMMCKIYDVSIDTTAFGKAVDKGNLAFYMLQLVGKKYGISVKDSITYEDAFDLVCEKTDYFNLEEGEFYADIYEYDVKLNYKRDTVWLYPQTLGTTNEADGTTVNVFIDGEDVKENYYVAVPIDTEKEIVPVVITVEFTEKTGAKKSSSYKINLYQGTKEPVQGGTISDALSGVKDAVENVLNDLGLDSSIAGIVAYIPFELPLRVLSLASLLIPSFDGLSLGSGFLAQLFGYSKNDDSNVNTNQIGGVGGLDSFNSSGNSSQSMNFGPLDIGNVQLNTDNLMPQINPADSIVIPDAQPENSGTLQVQDDGGWFAELMADTNTVIILIIVLILTFGICFILFMMIFNEKAARNKLKKKDSNK